MKQSVSHCCVVLALALAVALFSSVVLVVVGAGTSVLVDVFLMCVIYPASVFCDLPSFMKFERAVRTLLSHRLRTEGLLWRSLFRDMLQ